MSFLDDINKRRESINTIIHRQKLNIKSGVRALHIFVEGNDDRTFYGTFVRLVAGDRYKIHYYKCENKKAVLSATEFIKDSKNNYDLFFVDRDLSDFLGEAHPVDERLYITAYYAIESYLVRSEVVRIYLQETLWYDDSILEEDILTEIEAEFKYQLDSFRRYMMPVMAWIITLRKLGERPELDNIKPKDMFFFTEKLEIKLKNDFCPRRRIQYLRKSCSTTLMPNHISLLKQTVRELKSTPPEQFMRGKYDMWFVVTFIKQVIIQLQETAKKEHKAFKTRVELAESNFFILIASRILCPSDLDAFLRKVIPVT